MKCFHEGVNHSIFQLIPDVNRFQGISKISTDFKDVAEFRRMLNYLKGFEVLSTPFKRF